MNTCGTCKYKTAEIHNEPPDMCFLPGIGYTDRSYNKLPCGDNGYPLPLKTFFLCGMVKHNEQIENGGVPSTKALVVDGSGYYAALCVDDDFGCVLWEKK